MASPRSLIVEAYNSLSTDINKMSGRTGSETQQGVVSAKLPELSPEMDNADVLKLIEKYEKNWSESDVYAEWVKKSDENNNYWKGKHFQRPETDKTRALVDNVIFEALETSIPQYIARNPEPDVELRRNELGSNGEPTNPIATVYVSELQQDLADLGDELKLRSKFKKVARHWALDLLGVAKVGWDVQRDIPMLKVLRPRKIILDPDATVDEDGYTGDIVGEYRSLPAYKMIPFLTESGAGQVIKDLVKDDMATKVAFIEWWTDTTLLWTLGAKHVLLKRRNPHWNYNAEEKTDLSSDFTPVGIAPEGAPALPQMPEASEAPSAAAPGRPTLPQVPKATDGEEGMSNSVEASGGATADDVAVDEPDNEDSEPDEDVEGQLPVTDEQQAPRKDVNHFAAPRKPYLFLVMFNLGNQPVDNTSLITQNLSNQDVINKRQKQIDKNADNKNDGLIVSLERSGLTKSQAEGVTTALRKGGVVAIPAGAPQDAIWRPELPSLPAEIFENLNDLRNRSMSIFGVYGTTAQSAHSEKTVRGKIMGRQFDTDRIGGGISEVIEQFADDAYNWFVQLKLVYDDRYRQLIDQGEVPMVNVSIKSGSLLPRDKSTLANQAVELAGNGQMSKLDLYKALDYPNAEELAVNAWLEVNAPDILYKDDPRVAQAVQRQQQAAQAQAQAEVAAKAGSSAPKPPSESINFKDLPPDGRVQMAAKAGIQLHAEGVAAHEQLSKGGAESTPPKSPTAEPTT